MATLFAIDVGYVTASLYRIPVSLVICSGAIFLLIVYCMNLNIGVADSIRRGLKGLASEINWDIVLFMLSIFLVDQGLTNAGITDLLASLLVEANSMPSIFGIITQA